MDPESRTIGRRPGLGVPSFRAGNVGLMDRLPTPVLQDDFAGLEPAVHRLMAAHSLLATTDLALIERAVSREDTIGSLVDPTKYRDGIGTREHVRKLVRAGRAFMRDVT